MRLKRKDLKVVDVRKQGEWENGHVKGAEHICLSGLNGHMAEFSTSEPNYIHCQGGYRSMIAASILKARGIRHATEGRTLYLAYLRDPAGNKLCASHRVA